MYVGSNSIANTVHFHYLGNVFKKFQEKIKVSNCMDPDQDQTYCWS